MSLVLFMSLNADRRIETVTPDQARRIDQRCFIDQNQIDLDIGWDDLDCGYDFDLATGAIKE